MNREDPAQTRPTRNSVNVSRSWRRIGGPLPRPASRRSWTASRAKTWSTCLAFIEVLLVGSRRRELGPTRSGSSPVGRAGGAISAANSSGVCSVNMSSTERSTDRLELFDPAQRLGPTSGAASTPLHSPPRLSALNLVMIDQPFDVEDASLSVLAALKRSATGSRTRHRQEPGARRFPLARSRNRIGHRRVEGMTGWPVSRRRASALGDGSPRCSRPWRRATSATR